MTDANLMLAKCIHGIIWWDCPKCEVMPTVFEREEQKMTHKKVAWGLRRIYEMERRELTFRSEIDIRDGQIASLVSDLGVRDDFIQRLMKELSQHGWGDFHYGPQDQDRNIVALLEEGGFQYEIDLPRTTPLSYIVRRKNDGVEYGPFKTLAEANVWASENNELITIYPGEVANDITGTGASPNRGSGESGQRQDPVGRSGSREDPDSVSLLPEEGSTG